MSEKWHQKSAFGQFVSHRCADAPVPAMKVPTLPSVTDVIDSTTMSRRVRHVEGIIDSVFAQASRQQHLI